MAHMQIGTDIWQAFNLPTLSPPSSSPSHLLPANHPAKEQQGCAFLPCADPVLTNYPQSIHQRGANLQIWCNVDYPYPSHHHQPLLGCDGVVMCVYVCVWRGVGQHKRQGSELINRTVIVSTRVILGVGAVSDTVGCEGWMAREEGTWEEWGHEVESAEGITRHTHTHIKPHTDINKMHQNMVENTKTNVE